MDTASASGLPAHGRALHGGAYWECESYLHGKRYIEMIQWYICLGNERGKSYDENSDRSDGVAGSTARDFFACPGRGPRPERLGAGSTARRGTTRAGRSRLVHQSVVFYFGPRFARHRRAQAHGDAVPALGACPARTLRRHPAQG